MEKDSVVIVDDQKNVTHLVTVFFGAHTEYAIKKQDNCPDGFKLIMISRKKFEGIIKNARAKGYDVFDYRNA